MKNRQAYYILDPETDTKQEGDEYFDRDSWYPVIKASGIDPRLVYRRPIPDAPTPDDGWITWGGGECPVPGDTLVEVRFGSNDIQGGVTHARQYRWAHEQHMNIIAYRIVKPPEPQWLPLGPDDVPPGSVFRFGNAFSWVAPVGVASDGLCLNTDHHPLIRLTWSELMDNVHIEILRPGEDWKPCKKLKL